MSYTSSAISTCNHVENVMHSKYNIISTCNHVENVMHSKYNIISTCNHVENVIHFKYNIISTCNHIENVIHFKDNMNLQPRRKRHPLQVQYQPATTSKTLHPEQYEPQTK